MHDDALDDEDDDKLLQRLVAANQPFLQSQLDTVRAGNPDLAFACGVHEDITLMVSAPDDFPLELAYRGERDVRSALAAYSALMQPSTIRLLPEPHANLIFREGRAQFVTSSGLSSEVYFIERFNYRDKRLAYVQIVIQYVIPTKDG
jgi:hypothetical protein